MQGIPAFTNGLATNVQTLVIPGVFLLVLLWGAFQYMTSAGKNGKDTMMAGVIGMVIGLLASPLSTTLMGFARGGSGG